MNIDVAVAIIHYGEHYLLGFRNSKQHQGNRYEFVGGKIDNNETAKQALIREVAEEVGLDISEYSSINPLGILRHYYANVDIPHESKTVCLHIFRVELHVQQYQKLYNQKHGLEGQMLQWAKKDDLINNKYQLPDANKTILQWLILPDLITITQELDVPDLYSSDLDSSVLDAHPDEAGNLSRWIKFYHKKLSQQACVYIRLKYCNLMQREKSVRALIAARPDIKLIIDSKLARYLFDKNEQPNQVIAQHLTQDSMLDYLKSNDINMDTDIETLAPLPITISSHNQSSVLKVNKLAQYRLAHNLSPVIGVFISPVKQTKTHPDAVPIGWSGFAALAKLSEVPVIALGGISSNDLSQIRCYQGDKGAGISHFLT